MQLSRSLHASLCKSVLHTLHPRTEIKIVVQILHDDGSLFAATINATTLALIDAGIPLRSLVVAIGCVTRKNGLIILDPTKVEEEEEELQNSLTLQFNSQSRVVAVLLHLPVSMYIFFSHIVGGVFLVCGVKG